MDREVIYQHIRKDKLIRLLLKKDFLKADVVDPQYEYYESWFKNSFCLYSIPVPINQNVPNYVQAMQNVCEKLASIMSCSPLALAFFLSCDKAYIGKLSEIRIFPDQKSEKRMVVTVKASIPYDERDQLHQFYVPEHLWKWFADYSLKNKTNDSLIIGGDLDFEGTMSWTRQQGEEYMHTPRRIRFSIPTIVKYVDAYSYTHIER